KVRELEGSIGIADPFGPDIGDAVAVGIGRLRTWLPGEIGAHAVGRAEARTLADQNNDAVGTKCGCAFIADTGASLVRDDDRRGRSPAALAIVSTGAPSPARSAARRAASNGSCTASRARACASWNSSSGPVASDAPARLSPMRAAVSLRSSAHAASSAGLRCGE